MVLLIIFVLGPALMFNLYALTQFWREARRAGRSYFRRVERAVTVITACARQAEEHVPGAINRRHDPAVSSSRAVVMFPSRGNGPARRDVA